MPLMRAVAWLLLATLGLLAAGSANAEGERRGFLFELRKGAQVSLLFGTIHVGRSDFYPLPASRMARLSAVDALVLEADITDIARATAATQRYALYGADEEGLDRRLPRETLKRV